MVQTAGIQTGGVIFELTEELVPVYVILDPVEVRTPVPASCERIPISTAGSSSAKTEVFIP